LPKEALDCRIAALLAMTAGASPRPTLNQYRKHGSGRSDAAPTAKGVFSTNAQGVGAAVLCGPFWDRGYLWDYEGEYNRHREPDVAVA